jgi:hypothetical protein
VACCWGMLATTTLEAVSIRLRELARMQIEP